MSEKEKKILETIATAIPKMSEFDKGWKSSLMSKLRREDDHGNTVDSWNGRGCTFDFVDNSLCGVGLQKPSVENRSTHWRNSGCSLVSARATLEEYREDSYQQSDLGEIRSLEVDIDKEILRINGKEVKEKVLVTLPGPEGWPLQRIYNPEQVGECKKIDVSVFS